MYNVARKACQVINRKKVIMIEGPFGSSIFLYKEMNIAEAIKMQLAKEFKRKIWKRSQVMHMLTVMIVGLAMGATVMIVGVMSTPAEAVSGMVAYLTICFIGIPFIIVLDYVLSEHFIWVRQRRHYVMQS